MYIYMCECLAWIMIPLRTTHAHSYTLIHSYTHSLSHTHTQARTHVHMPSVTCAKYVGMIYKYLVTDEVGVV
jgi:hypothetical protein